MRHTILAEYEQTSAEYAEVKQAILHGNTSTEFLTRLEQKKNELLLLNKKLMLIRSTCTHDEQRDVDGGQQCCICEKLLF